MSTYTTNLYDYTPPKREGALAATPWTQAQIWYSPDNIQPYALFTTLSLSPLDSDPTNPTTRSFSVTGLTTATGWLQVVFTDNSGNSAPTNPVQYPPTTGAGAASPTALSARYAVRHRLRDGMPWMDANAVPFGMVRLEELTDQIGTPPPATPVNTVFQVRFADVPTGRYMPVNVIPGTLVAYVDGSWAPTLPTKDVDQNGNFTLPTPPTTRLLVTYSYQYLSDGEIDQFVDEARQWLREFSNVTQVPDGLVPALVSYASHRALVALNRSATLANIRAGDSGLDLSNIASEYATEAKAAYALAMQERKDFYTQGPEALDPTAVDVSAAHYDGYTPRN